MELETIKKHIIKTEYICDGCGKSGNITNMLFIIGKGLFHAKCYKMTKKV